MYSLCFIVAGNTALKLVYGYTATNKEDRLVKLVDEVIRQFSEMFVTNGFLVDFFSVRELHLHHAIYNNLSMCVSVLVRHVPKWLPGAAWGKKGAQV